MDPKKTGRNRKENTAFSEKRLFRTEENGRFTTEYPAICRLAPTGGLQKVAACEEF